MYTRYFKEDYRGEHEAPDKDNGKPMYDLGGMYPEDIYSSKAVQYYGDGLPYDGLAISIIQSAKGKPNTQVKIYRAVPDLNADLTKQIKELKYLIDYRAKFPFYPPNNRKIIHEIEDMFPIEKYDYNKQQELIHSEILNRIKKLETEKKKPLQLQPGNWVGIVKQYAIDHGKSSLNGKYKILSKIVPAKQLYTDGNSIHEWGWNP